MKVGIMSMQRIVNHGSFMQAYALKKMIEELGHEVVFVDFHVGLTIDKKKDLKKQIRHCIGKSYIGSIYHKYKSINKNLYKSELEIKYEQCLLMLGVTNEYRYRTCVDVLVIGSDEVFNCIQTNPKVGYSPELFGYKNRANKVITYAASFGSAKLEQLKNFQIDLEISNYLCKIDKISVRDENSKEIVNNLCGVIPEIHLDPVLVGNIENDFAVKCKEDKYIAVYGYVNRFTDEEGVAIRKYAKEKKLKLISLYGKQTFCDQNIVCRPDEVMGYFKNAEYIITDTFHGTIFSIINEKQFAVFVRSNSNALATNQEKLCDLLIRMQLNTQKVRSLDQLPSILESHIDYGRIKEIRSQQRKRTIDFLKTNLNEE